MKYSPELEKSFTARLSTHSKNWGGKPFLGLPPLSAHKQNKEIPSMAVLALFILTIDGIAYFAIGIFIFSYLSDIIFLVLLELMENRMNISNCNGDFELHSWEDLEKQIKESSTYPFDDIWISGETEYPCLSILINEQYTCVHYFHNNQGDMWQSIGYGNEDIAFESNGEKSDMPADAVISLNLAIECAKQFFETYKKPTCIKWRSL